MKVDWADEASPMNPQDEYHRKVLVYLPRGLGAAVEHDLTKALYEGNVSVMS